MGIYDDVANVKMIKEKTGAAKIIYMGFSQGTTQILYGLAKKEEEKAEEVVETTNASEETSENIVEDALDRGEATAEVVPASTEASELSTYDKFKDAFSVEQFDIKF